MARDQFLRVTCDDLDIDIVAATREELVESVVVELDVLWHNYATVLPAVSVGLAPVFPTETFDSGKLTHVGRD